MNSYERACAAVVAVLGAAAANADIYFASGHVQGTTSGSGTSTGTGTALTFMGSPGSFDLAPTGGSGGTSGGLSDDGFPVGASNLSYNLTAGTTTADFVRVVVAAAATFDTSNGAYAGSIGSEGTAQGIFRYVGVPMPFFARRIVDGVIIPGPWFSPVAGTGASLDNGIITPGDYMFSLAATVDSTTNPTEDRMSELIIPAPASLIVATCLLCTARRKRPAPC